MISCKFFMFSLQDEHDDDYDKETKMLDKMGATFPFFTVLSQALISNVLKVLRNNKRILKKGDIYLIQVSEIMKL